MTWRVFCYIGACIFVVYAAFVYFHYPRTPESIPQVSLVCDGEPMPAKSIAGLLEPTYDVTPPRFAGDRRQDFFDLHTQENIENTKSILKRVAENNPPPAPDFRDMVQFERAGAQDDEIGITPRLDIEVGQKFRCKEETYVGELEALHTFLRTNEEHGYRALVRDKLASKIPKDRLVEVIKIGFRGEQSSSSYEPFCVIDYSDYPALKQRVIKSEYGVITMWRLNSKLWFEPVATP